MADSSTAARDTSPRRRTALWTTAAGLAVLVATLVIARSWRDQLPDPVASHWGISGAADGFSSLTELLAWMLGGGVVLVLGFGAITLLLGQAAATRRIGAAMTIWAALFLGLLTLGTLYVQRGLTDARQVGDIGPVLLVAVIA
ncbi:MAG TPA: DUF1648 domain-containing protein, partial [Micromonosporaceae bacterium]